MKLKAPPGVGEPCVAGAIIVARDGLYEVEAEIGALLIECFGFAEVEARATAQSARRRLPRCVRQGPPFKLRHPAGDRRRKSLSGELRMAASDLAVLADVKTWLSGSSGIGTSDDALLARLITDVSGAIAAYLGRPALTPRAYMSSGSTATAARGFICATIRRSPSPRSSSTTAPWPRRPRRRRRGACRRLSARTLGRPAAGAAAGARCVRRHLPPGPAEHGDRL